MEKRDIIKILKRMLEDYKSVLDCKTYETLLTRCRKLSIRLGFCFWLDVNKNRTTGNILINELMQDSGLNLPPLEGFWYPTVSDGNQLDIQIDKCIKPRIINIERTIARLQREIQQTQQ
ncbi:hypothetical protein FUA48_08700 [Flavobacterium alkalisoli]|uniref:Uncharacterized protein n=1 Tax=Flavobacterium alkalisoli TaxID=2602769 RepID=A0A5B9FRN5_9FLAO|nr:hypothetical protein [Flavobacterium alkalisoli]QEE49660.1 hypothetical protein FUA48_08700 [Flavobacterium alkalisoli]